MEFIKTEFEGLWVIKPKVFGDERGYFFESYNETEFKKYLPQLNFVQDNQSLSNKGVLRGLHFQVSPFAQGKLIRVINGSVRDIALDIRPESKTFGRHFNYVLTAADKTMLYIPPGFAHGFLTLEDNTIFSYKCTGFYNKDAEKSILWNDPELEINWDIEHPVLSEKDKFGVSFKSYFALT